MKVDEYNSCRFSREPVFVVGEKTLAIAHIALHLFAFYVNENPIK